MSTVKAIKSHYTNDANEVLAEAMEQGFEVVVVLGLKDGNLNIRRSAMISRLQLLGAIEEAKHHVLEN